MTECVLLAAGRGERFAAGAGTGAGARAGAGAGLPGGRQLKPLAPFRGEPLILHGLRNALAACVRCVVVTGYGAQSITPVIAGIERVTVVYNEHFDRGMVWSIACGLEAVEQPLAFIAPADMPALHPNIYQTLQGVALGEQSSHPVAYMPVFQERQGHPVLVHTALRDDLRRALEGTAQKGTDPPGSMRAFLQRYPVQEIPVQTDAILWDIDTPEELARG